MVEKPALPRYAERNVCSVLMVMSLNLKYSAFTLFQKFASAIDSKQLCKPSSANSSKNVSFKWKFTFNSSILTFDANRFRIPLFSLRGSFFQENNVKYVQ